MVNSIITKVIAKSAEWDNIAKNIYIHSEHGNKWLDNQTDLIFRQKQKGGEPKQNIQKQRDWFKPLVCQQQQVWWKDCFKTMEGRINPLIAGVCGLRLNSDTNRRQFEDRG